MSGGGGGRVPIPNNVRKIIQDIREITGKQHNDDEIYAVLKECSMDPNETTQKLLYLDNFHEVRRRRDRKKERLSSRASEDSRSKQAGQGRGGRGGSGVYSSNFPDGAGGRNPAIHRENGINNVAERGQGPSTRPVLQKAQNLVASQAIRVSAVGPNGPVSQSNGSSNGSAGQTRSGSVTSVSESSTDIVDNMKHKNDLPQAAAVVVSSLPVQTSGSIARVDRGKTLSSFDQIPPASSSSAPVVFSFSLVPKVPDSLPLNFCFGDTSDINGEVGSQWIASGVNHIKGDKIVFSEVGDSLASKSKMSESLDSTSENMTLRQSNKVNKNQISETSRASSPSFNGSLMSSSSYSQPPSVHVSKVSTSEVCAPSSADLKKYVIFPNHFQVPEAFKNGLTFGSFDSNSGQKEGSSNGTGRDNNNLPALESSLGNVDTATSSDQSASIMGSNHPNSSAEGNSTSGADSKGNQPTQEVLLTTEVPPVITVQNDQNYGLNFMPTMLGSQQFPFEGAEPQTQEASCIPTSVDTNSQAASSPSPTSPRQSSIPVSPQSVSIFRPSYPPNFFPYGHYYPPIYVSPVHQFLSHNGFPQHPSAGNLYLPATAGIKFPLPQFKAGANTGNMAHIGIPCGSFVSPPVAYAPSLTVNTASSTGNEDHAVSQLKENHTYSTGQLSEGSAVWTPSPGHGISSMQVNSLYNLSAQGQHLAFSPAQAGRSAFAGIYHPGQRVASHSTLLQHSRTTGVIESGGPPSVAYQQPQHAHINWN